MRVVLVAAAALVVAVMFQRPARAEEVTWDTVLYWIEVDAAAYGVDPGWLTRVATCEARSRVTGIPNPYSVGLEGEVGPFQWHPRGLWWDTPAGRNWESPWDIRRNVEMAAWAFSRGLWWHWTCARLEDRRVLKGRELLAYRFGLWNRQFGDTAERTLTGILTTMRDYGHYDLLVQKVADGTTWQGWIDPATPLRSSQDVIVMQQSCEAWGTTMVPCVVPRGRDIRAEALMHAEIAERASALVVDLEPYEEFWDGSDFSRIPEYWVMLRDAAPTAYLVNQPDPRPWAIDAARTVETAPFYNAIAAQHYVGWSAAQWTSVQREVQAFRDFFPLGKDMYATLYGVDRIDLAAEFWRAVQPAAMGAHAFRMGAMNADQLRFFGGLPRSVAPPPPPPPPPGPVLPTALELARQMRQRTEDDRATAMLSYEIRREQDERVIDSLGGNA